MLVALIFAMAIFVDNFPRHTHTIDMSSAPQQPKSIETVTQNKTKDKKSDLYGGIVRPHSLWVENVRYLYDYKDGFISGDKEFLLQMVREGKAHFVEAPAGVVCDGTYAQGEIIRIKFFEGRYKNRHGYIFADFVKKME